ncbi:WD40-repeat-containing domain protein, partial [Mycena galopus ATCC 62051]
QQLTSGSKDTFAQIWDIEMGHCILQTEGHTTTVSSIAFSPDGCQLVTGLEDCSIRVWDQTRFSVVHRLYCHSEVFSLSISPDGTTLVSGSADNVVRLWDIAKQKCTQVIYGHSKSVLSVSFSPDERWLVLTSGEPEVLVWNTKSG